MKVGQYNVGIVSAVLMLILKFFLFPKNFILNFQFGFQLYLYHKAEDHWRAQRAVMQCTNCECQYSWLRRLLSSIIMTRFRLSAIYGRQFWPFDYQLGNSSSHLRYYFSPFFLNFHLKKPLYIGGKLQVYHSDQAKLLCL